MPLLGEMEWNIMSSVSGAECSGSARSWQGIMVEVCCVSYAGQLFVGEMRQKYSVMHRQQLYK